MSMILCEGFDADDVRERATAYNIYATGTGRTGSTAFYMQDSNRWIAWAFGASEEHATFIVGFAFKDDGGALGTQYPMSLYGDGGSTKHIRLRTNADGSVDVVRGDGTVLGSTSVNVIQAATWHYIELYVTLSDTVGVVKLRIDGKTPPGWSDLTGQDTKNGGTATVFNYVRLNDSASGCYVDDVVICNGAGTVSNDLIGDTAVYTLYPNGNGNYSQLTGQDADSVDNYLNVDEAVIDDDTTYNESATDGQKDTYSFDDLVPTAGTVIGVQASAYARKDDAGAKSCRLVHREGVTDSTGSDKTLQTSYDTHDEVWTLDPSTGLAWSITGVNASEFGVEVRP